MGKVRPLDEVAARKAKKLAKRQSQVQERDRAKPQVAAAGEALTVVTPARVATATEFPFTVDPNDHCETCPEAYSDIVPLLELIAKRLGKAPGDLAIYDPYYCSGAMRRHLGALGFRNVYNRCEDFYARCAAGLLPEHDVVVTNPPYSEVGDGGPNHIARLLRFCLRGGKPFLINMPEYVVSTGFYKRRFLKHPPPLLMSPYKRYCFWTPTALKQGNKAPKGAAVSHRLGVRCSRFAAFWYVSLEPLVSHDSLMRKAERGRLLGIESRREDGAAELARGIRREGELEAARCRLCRVEGDLPEGAARRLAKRPRRRPFSESAPISENAPDVGFDVEA